MRSGQVLLLASGFAGALAAPNTIKAKINPSPKQTLVSFGASGAWWPNDLILFPQKMQKQLGEFLFSSDGMHLSSYRYNMGGGGDNDDNDISAWESRVESFLLNNGTYDFTRDHAGVTFLKMAASYNVPDITFFINAAPAAIASNHAACGWNMTAEKIPAFSKYISTVLSHFIEKAKIPIKYISPMNEPDNDRSTCTQEGMGVAPSLRSSVIHGVRNALDSSAAKSVSIIADETSQVSTQAIPEDPEWLPSAAPAMANIAVHNYDYPTDAQLSEYYAQLVNLTSGSSTNKESLPPVKFTETCCSTNAGHGSSVFGAQYDPSMSNALIVARYVWQFLTIVQAVSFDWWTAVTYLPCSPSIDGQQCATAVNETSGYNSGLVYIDPNYNQTKDYNLYYTKRAFMLKHFATFHRPGSVRYEVPQTQLPSSINAVASKLDGTWSVLFMNHAMTAQTVEFAVPASGAKLTRVVKTTNETDFEDVKSLPKAKNGMVPVKLPAQSLVTMQFSS